MSQWRLRVDAGRSSGSHDVVVDGSPDSPATDLVGALADAGFRGDQAWVGGWGLTPGRTLRDLQLVNGDTVSFGTVRIRPVDRQPGTYLVVIGGIDAGKFLRVDGREQLVGRDAGAQLRLSDQLVGRRHLIVTEAGDDDDQPGVRITDLGSGNGSVLDGEPLDRTVVARRGAVVACGATLLAVEHIANDDLLPLAQVDGTARPFARRFREALPPLADRLVAPAQHDDDEEMPRPGWWRPLIPLVSGAGLVLITGRWLFLIVMAFGPILLFFEAQRSRKAYTRRTERRRERSEKALAAHEAQVTVALAAEQRRRRQVAPSAGTAVLHGLLRSRHLWARTIEDDDFGTVTVGFAALPPALRVEGRDATPVRELWRVPVPVPLVATGSIAVLGSPARSQAVARGLVLSLATNHSPNDLRIWVLSDRDRAGGWAFTRWLPHAFLEGGGARLAVTPDERAVLLNYLNQNLENRADKASGGSDRALPLPLDVVVLDWPGSADHDDVAALLSRGAPHGILGLAVEADRILEGVRGTIKLSHYADEASFESRLQPRVDGLVVAEVDHDTADQVARAMAGLRPAAGGEGAGAGEPATLRLLELLELEGVEAGTVAERWRRASPNMAAMVGRGSGVPMTVDLVRNGPHGLVGGTTRSGKTEFLKTLFASLMLQNTPDDLSILIVDFKGGVDHAPFAGLPHVISLSTNADVDRFTRTIALLVAEQVRRQELFRSCGAANLDAYRGVRLTDPGLPPVPRLLVVVDEFGELLATEIGREHLKTLESVTRIGGGLGIHLLLVTQTFENQLPAQVAANTGLRVCFRVQQPSDSKVVLESGAAASIPPSRPGRALARFQRADLVEFQSARVAGRRPDHRAGPPPVRVLVAPLGTLATFAAAVESSDPPVSESDLGGILASIRQAAARTGWERPAIPWPDELPRAVLASDLLATMAEPSVVLGLSDVPDRQAHEAVVLPDDEEHLLLVGGSRSGAGDALLAVVTVATVVKGPEAFHAYAVDLVDGALAPLSVLPSVGAVAYRNEGAALRIVRHLLDVVAERRALFTSHGVSSVAELSSRGLELPQVVLALHGADRLIAKEENTPTPVTGAVLRLLAESPGTGVNIWMTGSSALGYTRLGTGISRRFVFAIPDTTEYPNLGVPRGMAAELDGPGRAIDIQSGRLLQLACLTDDPAVPPGDVVRAVGQVLAQAPAAPERLPKRLADVAWPLSFERLDTASIRPPRGFSAPLPIGVETSTGQLLWLDVEEEGPVVALSGGGRSGRSSGLLAVAELARLVGWRVVGLPASRRSLLWDPSAPLDELVPVSATRPLDPPAIDGPTLFVIDDAHRLDMDDLGLKPVFDAPHHVGVVVAGAVDFIRMRVGFLKSLPKIRAGVILAPSSSDAAFGLSRVPDTVVAESRPGRGLLVVNGEWQAMQFPLRRYAAID